MAADKNPWMHIWWAPQETLRAIVDKDPARGFFPLSCIYGFLFAWHLMLQVSAIAFIPLWALLVGTLLLSPLLGMVAIYVISWLLHISGRLIGGKSDFSRVRTAYVWSTAPDIFKIGLWLLGFWRGFGGAEWGLFYVSGYSVEVVSFVMVIERVISIWGWIILMNGLVVVQGFSLWRACLNVLIVIGVFVFLRGLAVWI